MKQTQYAFSSNQGFSLIEIMVVLIIIGVITAGVGARFLGKADQARVDQAMVDFATIEQALKLYRLDNYRYPTNEQGLDALVNKPTIDPVPRQWQSGGYLDALPIDPWGNPYAYMIPGERGEFDLYSLGADGQSGGQEFDADIYNWQRFEGNQ
ncbi:MAG: type II secretion system major pseudopilin GspG [Cellvibrionaceae bacterium]|nr:type II secretion system major pseudopilin GspG [Cellvibrionaceae bacterium]